jgi:hypothetical protein
MDWLLHGFKALVNNFINSLYSSFLAAKDLLQRQKAKGKPGANEYEARERQFISAFGVVQKDFSEPKNNTFKLTGTEACIFAAHYEKIILTLDQKRKDTMKLFELLLSLFALLRQSRKEKLQKYSTYIELVKSTAFKLIVLWKLRFGDKNYDAKQYLHATQHLWQIEKFCLDNNLPTIETYSMEGREHKNKGIAAFCNRHYPGEEETSKRGRKTEAQRELEKQIVEKEKDIDLEVNAIFVKFTEKVERRMK